MELLYVDTFGDFFGLMCCYFDLMGVMVISLIIMRIMSPSRKTILVVMFEAFSHSWENEDTLGGVLYQECRKGRELKKMEKHICSLQSSCLPTTYNYISYLQPEQ